MKERIEYYDVLRAIAITAVIGIHTTGDLESLYISNRLSFHLAVIWRQIIGFAVPLFLTISGYFLSNKHVSDKENYTKFLSKQVPRVYVPMLIWSLPLFIATIVLKKALLKPLVLMLVGGFSVYYFIALIIQYYALLPILQRISNLKGVIYSTIISFASLSLFFYLSKVLGYSIPLIAYAGPFPMWIMFFVLGIYLGRNKITISKPALVVLTTVGLILSVAETYWIFNFTNSFQGLGIKIGAFIYSLAIILLLFSLEYKPKAISKQPLGVFNKLGGVIWNLMAHYGRISFGVYLIHKYVLSYISLPVYRIMGVNNYFIEQSFLILFTMIICVAGITIVRKINNPFAVKYLGF